jgi:hypothetical protein
MSDQLNDAYAVRANLINAMGIAQIHYWCQQLECSTDELLNAIPVVGFSAEDIYLYLHHKQ